MSELFTQQEIEAHLRDEVREAGGAKKWLKRHKLGSQFDHVLHMVENGSAATLPRIQYALKFKTVIMYAPSQ